MKSPKSQLSIVSALFALSCASGTQTEGESPAGTTGSPTTGVSLPTIDQAVFEPPAAGVEGAGPNPNTVISAVPQGCSGEGESYPKGLESCYRIVMLPALSWAQASIDCTLWSAGRGHLASVTTSAEDEYLRSIAGGARIWLGASDSQTEATWEWLSGETWFYEHFAAERPDNVGRSEHCLTLDNDGFWDDAPCELELPYVCERAYGETHEQP